VRWKPNAQACDCGRKKSPQARFLLICDAYIQIIVHREYFNQVECTVLISNAGSWQGFVVFPAFFESKRGALKENNAK